MRAIFVEALSEFQVRYQVNEFKRRRADRHVDKSRSVSGDSVVTSVPATDSLCWFGFQMASKSTMLRLVPKQQAKVLAACLLVANLIFSLAGRPTSMHPERRE